ncbi:MAG: alanine racemase [Pseudomonadota bacterium]
MSYAPVTTINLSAVASNWHRLSARAPGSETGATVKADGYGLGAVEVSKALFAAGCRTFFTAYANEAIAVRAAIGSEPRIYVLNGPVKAERALYTDHNLSGVLSTPEQVECWFKGRLEQPFALKFDTGMNRLGLPVSEVSALSDAAARDHTPSLVMSHLACGEDASNPMTIRQLGDFRAIADHFPGIPKSLANSAGCALGPDYAFDLTRPGIALYGGAPDTDTVVTLTAKILSVHDVEPGETVGYGATHRFEAPAKLATLSLGYADGLMRSFSNTGIAILGGQPCPFVGRVSMDLATIDVTAAAPLAKPGASVEVLGEQADLMAQASRAGTISYELLTALGPRVERTYER